MRHCLAQYNMLKRSLRYFTIWLCIWSWGDYTVFVQTYYFLIFRQTENKGVMVHVFRFRFFGKTVSLVHNVLRMNTAFFYLNTCIMFMFRIQKKKMNHTRTFSANTPLNSNMVHDMLCTELLTWNNVKLNINIKAA